MRKGKIFVGMCALFVLGCADEAPVSPRRPHHHEQIEQTLGIVQFTENADQHRLVVQNSGATARTYELPVSSGGHAIWRLYFSIANTQGTTTALPKASVLQATAGMRSGSAIRTGNAPAPVRFSRSPTSSAHIHRMAGVEHVHPPTPSIRTHQHRGAVMEARPPRNDMVGATETFTLAPGLNNMRTTVEATARYVREVGGQRVVFWVPDNLYTGCTTDCLRQDSLLSAADIAVMADAFLKAGDDNDIHDLSVAIFGTHWGAHMQNDYIAPSFANQVDILLYNIGNRQGDAVYRGGVLGYFWSGNNFLSRREGRSNERLLLAIHAPWFKVSREYMAEEFNYSASKQTQEFERYRFAILSALAHEYQHLINFYQRYILDTYHNREDSAWLNEQFSLMSEDLLHDYLFGPTSTNVISNGNTNALDYRGLSTLGAGDYGICDGMIPNYLPAYGSRGISQWQNRLWNYGINYSFGAYLLRNYGGVTFLRNAYNVRYKDAAAISHALSVHTPGLDMGEAVRRWGVATLLSDRVNAGGAYTMNNGTDGFISSYDGVTYRVGSINYYNYVSECGSDEQDGAFRIFRSSESIPSVLGTSQDGHSAIPIAIAENVNGTARFKVTLSPGHTLTAIAKRQRTTHNPVFY